MSLYFKIIPYHKLRSKTEQRIKHGRMISVGRMLMWVRKWRWRHA